MDGYEMADMVCRALGRIDKTLFDTLGSGETGDALRALAELPYALERIEDRLDDIDQRLCDVRDVLVVAGFCWACSQPWERGPWAHDPQPLEVRD